MKPTTITSAELLRIDDHADSLRSALLVLELMDEESSPGTPRLAALIELGKLAIGSKLELLEALLYREAKRGTA